MAIHQPRNPDLRTILELCGAGTPEDALEELDRHRPSPPPLADKLKTAIELAADDAAHCGQPVVHSDNLFIGLLRQRELPIAFVAEAGLDVVRLRAAIGDRLREVTDSSSRPILPLDAEAQALVARAIAIADERRHDHVTTIRLLEALVEDDSSSTAELIVACGGKLASLRASLARA